MIQNHPCATEAGIAAHIRYYDPPCRICKEWAAKVKAGEASKPAPIKAPKKPKVKTPRTVAECGSTGGFHQHVYNKTEACQPCRDAINAYNREQSAKRAAAKPKAPRPKPVIEHGTAKGRDQHAKSYGEQPCEPCRLAYNAHNAKRRAERLARKAAQ